MWSNRKARFTVLWIVILGVNLALWFAHREFGYAMKVHPAVFTAVFVLDVALFFGLACIGLISSWALAFRPEMYVRVIERSIARRNARRA